MAQRSFKLNTGASIPALGLGQFMKSGLEEARRYLY
jgi:diketogulonate reductase-like aldo/keto reductase